MGTGRICLSIFDMISVHKIRGRNFVDIDGHIDAVENGSRNTFAVGFDLARGAGTFVSLVAEIAARAGVHGGNKDEISRVSDTLIDAADGNLMVFEGLPESFENGAGVFGDFIEEENAVMGERDFARGGAISATNDGGRTGGVMRGAKRSGKNYLIRFTREGMNFGNGDLFRWGRSGEEIGGDLGKEGLAGTRRTREKNVMATSDSDREGALGEGLTADFV